MANDRNSFEKRQREVLKKRKQGEKRERRRLRKEAENITRTEPDGITPDDQHDSESAG